jgi:hypothetical protein
MRALVRLVIRRMRQSAAGQDLVETLWCVLQEGDLFEVALFKVAMRFPIRESEQR